MNPELRRNIWIECTPQRICLPPLILGLLYLGVTAGHASAGDRSIFLIVYFLCSCLWGTRAAFDAVPSEARDHTWDGQRMTPISAWSMTWGKLFGSTIHTWYAALISMFIAVVGFTSSQTFAEQALMIFSLLCCGVIAQSVCFAMSLENVSSEARRNGRLGGAVMILFFLIGLPAANFGVKAVIERSNDRINWFGMDFEPLPFLSISFFVFAVWGLLGAYRMMRAELLYRNTPIAWASFLLFSALYWNGFLWTFDLTTIDRHLPEIPVGLARSFFVSLLIFLSLGWALLITERKDLVRFRRAYLRVKERKSLSEVLPYLPKWLLCILFAIVAAIGYGWSAFQAVDTPALGELLRRGLVFAVSLLLLFSRDACVVMLLHLSPRFRHRAQFASLLILGVLYVLVPWFFFQIGAAVLAKWCLPSAEANFSPFVPLLAQLAVAAALLWSRVSTTLMAGAREK